MRALLRLLLLPLRAPMLLWLLAVSVYLGMHWGHPYATGSEASQPLAPLVWSAQCLQAMLVVILCCMPDLLLRRFSMMLAASRFVTLVATLLLVTIGGLYLLHLDVFSNVLILASSVLLARLDLVRIRVVPSPPMLAIMLAVLVFVGAGVGRRLEIPLFQAEAPQRDAVPPLLKPQRMSPQLKRMPILGRVHAPTTENPPSR